MNLSLARVIDWLISSAVGVGSALAVTEVKIDYVVDQLASQASEIRVAAQQVIGMSKDSAVLGERIVAHDKNFDRLDREIERIVERLMIIERERRNSDGPNGKVAP